jgi:hypothetical protein
MHKNNFNIIYGKWTKTAVDCYLQNVCTGCNLEEFCKTACKNNPYNMPPMKYGVLMLVKRYGIPEDHKK